jgi:micrococcal nuclease
MRTAALALSVSLALACPAAASESCALPVAEEAGVAAITDGGSFDLADGRHVRLAGVQAPMLSLGRSNVADWPLAGDAKAQLAKLILGKRAALAFDDRSVDRHGHLVAHVFVGGEWIEGRMVGEGLARVRTQWDVRKCAAALLAREREAREAKRGVWALPFYAVRKPEDLDRDVGTFQIVEATVAAAVERRDRIYLNFGPDYRTDFTATISPRDARRMAKEKKDPLAWRAKRVRIRGWVALLNGPEIELTHPEQIEVLD